MQFSSPHTQNHLPPPMQLTMMLSAYHDCRLSYPYRGVESKQLYTQTLRVYTQELTLYIYIQLQSRDTTISTQFYFYIQLYSVHHTLSHQLARYNIKQLYINNGLFHHTHTLYKITLHVYKLFIVG